MKNKDNIIICRCEDITYGEIIKAIDGGAKDINSIKKITRAGMGCCQGHICENLIQNILFEKNIMRDSNSFFLRKRMPAYNITIKELAEFNE